LHFSNRLERRKSDLMALARLQQLFVFSLIATVIAWLILAPAHVPAFVVIGVAFGVVFGYACVLAIEFALLLVCGAESTGLRPTLAQIIRAWWGEVLSAPQVFCWRQPWRFDAEPDWLPNKPRAGVLLVHGFFCNRGFWNPWMTRLRAAGIPYVAVSLEPVFGSIDSHSPAIEVAVNRLWQATGHAPLVIAHSMGGLVVRSWLAGQATVTRVRRIFTIGSPHRGTWLARFSAVLNGSQMRMGSSWLDDLAKRETSDRGPLFVCYYSNCDNIVFPASSATLPGADNRQVDGIAHVHMAFHPRVMDSILSEIRVMNDEPDA
jgi:triacylglycerol lipase